MEHSISSDLIRGHIDTIILHTLIDGDKYPHQKTIQYETEQLRTNHYNTRPYNTRCPCDVRRTENSAKKRKGH